MKIRRAVITAAGRNQRNLPLQTLVDRDGQQKSALQIIIEEVMSAGIEEVCLVVCPGDQDAYARAAGHRAPHLRFVEQPTPRGYGHALWCARQFVNADPFMHLVSDHLYISQIKETCARQLVQVAADQNCAVSAVQSTRESMLPYYGVIGGQRVPRQKDLYEIETVREKPTPTEAEQQLVIPGLRAGHYLGFLGMHVLTPMAMDILGELVKSVADDSIELSPALGKLAARERYLAFELQGQRFNIGVQYGLLMTQLALALDGKDREEILAQLLELLANRRTTNL